MKKYEDMTREELIETLRGKERQIISEEEKNLLTQILLDSLPCVAMLIQTHSKKIVLSNEIARKAGCIPCSECYVAFTKRKEPCSWCLAEKAWTTGKPQHREFKLIRAAIPVNIDIVPDMEENESVVFADPSQIHQIVINLCTNAYHAMMEKGGVLRISLSNVNIEDSYNEMKPGKYVRLTVSDTGYGIDHKIINRIFEPYFTTVTSGENSGLGLAVVHGIVKSYNGEIKVISEPGKGTSFLVYLPVIKTDSEINEYSTEQIKPPTCGGTERILIVEDEAILILYMKHLLQDLGYEVVAKMSGNNALEAFRKDPDKFNLVITDQSMPGMTGIDLAKEVMLIRPDIPVILYTGFSETVDREKALSLGIKEYLMKPVSSEELLISVDKALGHYEKKEN